MKRIVPIIVFMFVVLLIGMGEVSANSVEYKCEYTNSSNSEWYYTITIYTDLSHTGGGYYGNVPDVTGFRNWNSLKVDIDRLGCPTYLVRHGAAAMYNNYGYWKMETLEKSFNTDTAILFKLAKATKSNNDGDCKYDSSGTLTSNGTYVIPKGNKSNNYTFSESASGHYYFKGKAADFLNENGEWKCVNKLIIRNYRATPIHRPSGVEVYDFYSSEEAAGGVLNEIFGGDIVDNY